MNSSKLPSGAVCASGIVAPLASAPLEGVPGLTSTVSSFNWVFGRSSIVAFLKMRSCAYFGVRCIVTTATPLLRSTLAISPIFAPAIVTA